MTRLKLIFAASILAPFAALRCAEITIVRDAQPIAAVVLGEGIRAADSSVKVLISNLRQMSGATLPVMGESELSDARIEAGRLIAPKGKADAGAFILLGEGALTRRLGLSLDGVGKGGILMKSGGNTIALIARDDGGGGKRKDVSSRAVFSFLDALGCRSLWPGETGKVVPQKRTLIVPDLDVHFTPPIGQRNIRFTDGQTRGLVQGLLSLGSSFDEYRAANSSLLRKPRRKMRRRTDVLRFFDRGLNSLRWARRRTVWRMRWKEGRRWMRRRWMRSWNGDGRSCAPF